MLRSQAWTNGCHCGTNYYSGGCFVTHGGLLLSCYRYYTPYVRFLLSLSHPKVIPSPHGVKYVLEGVVETPSGTAPRIRTIWILETGEENPRLVDSVSRLRKHQGDVGE